MRGFYHQYLNEIFVKFEVIFKEQNQSSAHNIHVACKYIKKPSYIIGLNVFNIICGKWTMLKSSKESNSTIHFKEIKLV